ncbi:hypothetical protein KUC3_11260 [Alteromonas sp. KC3]|nr:hypothetical protein KUC3_11260 [Alteromonas sp. KC3]BCO22229.1 hypothetical protein KUC14_10980 [Alteromonas sp. KC14]
MKYECIEQGLYLPDVLRGIMMTLKQTENLVTFLLVFSLGLLGLTFLLGASPGSIKATLHFYGLSSAFSDATMGVIAGVAFLMIALLAVAARLKLVSIKLATLFTFIIVSIPLLTLLSPSRWMADLGGFPIIGSGQGIIKYVAVFPLFFFLFYRHKFTDKQLAWANYVPVAMVLLWIGGMKFYEFEANGIVGLIETSPFMSWLYTLFSVQGASNVIGVFDVFFALALGIGLLLNQKTIIKVSGLAALSVFLMTQTFIFTVPDTLSSETIFNRLGQFVIKDLWFIANLVVVGYYTLWTSATKSRN